MAMCSVIQPFDGSKFGKRYADVLAPAKKGAGLEPYRVDQDPKVEVPIDAIEDVLATGLSRIYTPDLLAKMFRPLRAVFESNPEGDTNVYAGAI